MKQLIKILSIGALLLLSVPAHSQLLSEDQVAVCNSIGTLSVKIAYNRSRNAPKEKIMELVSTDNEKLSALLTSIVDMIYDIEISSIDEARAVGEEMNRMCLIAFQKNRIINI